MTSPSNAPKYSKNNEIDLFELAQDLWQQKWLILAITGLFTLLAVVYALLATPIYQTAASIMPPRPADIAPVNLGRDRADIEELDIDDAYSIATRNLTSQTVRRWFFDEYFRPYLNEQGVSGARDSLVERMNQVLRVYVPDVRNNPSNYVVQVSLSDPEKAAEFANVFVEEVARRSLRDLEMNTRAQVSNKRRSLEEYIDALVTSARIHRLDRIARLKEALAIAEAIGMENPQFTGGNTQVSVSGSAGVGDSVQMSDGSMLFLNGTKAIRAELALLEARENDAPFIGELRGVEQRISMLNLVDPLPEQVRLFTLDSAADVPENPIKPNKVMIVGVGIGIGGMLAGTIALVRVASGRRNNDKSTRLRES